MKLRQILNLEEKLFNELAATFPVILDDAALGGMANTYLDHSAKSLDLVCSQLHDAAYEQFESELLFLKCALLGYHGTVVAELGFADERAKQAGALVYMMEEKAYGSVYEILSVMGAHMVSFADCARKLDYLVRLQNLSDQVAVIADAFTEVLSQTGDEFNIPNYREFRKCMTGGFAHRMPNCSWTYLEFYKGFNNAPGSENFIDSVIRNFESLEDEDQTYGILATCNLKEVLLAISERVKSSDIGTLAEEVYNLRTGTLER